MAAATESTSFEEEQLPSKRETMTWKPRKECLLENIPNVQNESGESEFSDSSHDEEDVSSSSVDCVHILPDLEELGGEVSSMLEAVTFQEVEDWDKELEESECNPYDADDLYCGSFQENNLLASCSQQEDLFYSPCCHHAAHLNFTQPVRMTEFGQFDDADE
ncbi:coordinator of PRMT5 and differentiation stimulator [Opisthocomus hoazin]|uniref:coordinator of PRMT5 and differentiation stimulator n=1 Tax=Opisthocomus hoazin TaxID=30419 RepID=UPI00052250E7|nr:PREDICTED: coordinator of PRMT5 and differentiation stimulator [Opisthocomus hoazin]